MMSGSESASHVRLFPPADTAAQRSAIPKQYTVHWRPPFADDGAKSIVSIFVTSSAYEQFNQHSRIDLDNEVGGGLVGKWRVDRQSSEQFIVVEAVLPARFTRQGSAFLTFTQDSLVAMNDELEELYPGKQLVGWYHTHPGMRVFLSHYDLWLHGHFFPEPWQVALVIEPHSAAGGFFIRQEDGHLDPHRYFGFIELVEQGKSSVVSWSNMRLADEMPADDGVHDNDE